MTGRLRPAEATEPTDAPPPGQAWAADPQVLVTASDTPRYNAYAELMSSTPAADAELTALPVPGHRGLNNLVYSVQWLLFGLVGIIGWWRLIRGEGRRSDESDEIEAAAAGTGDLTCRSRDHRGLTTGPRTRLTSPWVSGADRWGRVGTCCSSASATPGPIRITA